MGAPSKRIQHPGRSSLRKTRVCARNANQAGPLLPSGPKVQGIAVVSVMRCFVPSEDAQTAGPSRFVLSADGAFLSVRGEATLANNKHQHGSRAEAPSPLLPLRPRLKSQPGRRRTGRGCERVSQTLVQGPPGVRKGASSATRGRGAWPVGWRHG